MKILRTLPFVVAAMLCVLASAAGASSRALWVLGVLCLVMAAAVSAFGYVESPTRWGVFEVPERPRVQRRRLQIIGLSLAVICSAAVLQWPLRACFWLSRPALERLAQQVRRGEVVDPQDVGPFTIKGARLDKGQVVLWLDDNVLVRKVPGREPRWSNQETTDLDSSWSLYHEM